jgi:hypothetical protein
MLPQSGAFPESESPTLIAGWADQQIQAATIIVTARPLRPGDVERRQFPDHPCHRRAHHAAPYSGAGLWWTLADIARRDGSEIARQMAVFWTVTDGARRQANGKRFRCNNLPSTRWPRARRRAGREITPYQEVDDRAPDQDCAVEWRHCRHGRVVESARVVQYCDCPPITPIEQQQALPGQNWPGSKSQTVRPPTTPGT